MSLETPPVPQPPPAPVPAPIPAASAPAPPVKGRFFKRVWNYLTSFQLAVLVLSLSIGLVFLGTLAQVHEGLYLAQTRWFKSWLVLRQTGDPWWVWIYPGGYLLGTVFLVNMLGAHFRRLKYPPGGLLGMTAHYILVMVALFFITKSLLWLPFYFVMAQLVLIGVDLALCIVNKRLESSGRKIGVDLVHLGIAVLLLGQLGTDLFAKETHLDLKEGQTKHYSESYMETELAIARTVDKQSDEVTVFPDTLLSKPGQILKADKLPFTVQVKEWMGNSDLLFRAKCLEAEANLRQAFATVDSKYSLPEQLPAASTEALSAPGRKAVWDEALQSVGEPAGSNLEESAKKIAADPVKSKALLEALKSKFHKQMLGGFQMRGGEMAYAASFVADGKTLEESFPPPQASSPIAKDIVLRPLPEKRDMESRNIPAAIIELTGQDGVSLGTWPVTPALSRKNGDLYEQTVTVQGQDYRLALRLTRTYHTFAMTLLKATHEKYPGTETPKDFRSRVRIQEDAKQGDRETEIFMNSPLRFENGNLTFFQSGMDRTQVEDANVGWTSLQVVRNPGWFSPYFGCALVAYGMCRHFLLHLGRFISRKKAS